MSSRPTRTTSSPASGRIRVDGEDRDAEEQEQDERVLEVFHGITVPGREW